jgi:hypothetical protein
MRANSVNRDPLDQRQHEHDEETRQVLERERRAQEIADFRWLMEQPQGRRFAWRMLAEAGVYRSTFNSSGSITAYQEGQRKMGLWLMLQIHEHAPASLLAMLEESKTNE